MEPLPSAFTRIAPIALVALAIAGLVFLGREGMKAVWAPATEDAAPEGQETGGQETEGQETERQEREIIGPVTVEGRVVDARTAAGIGRAVVIVLRPEVSTQEWIQARSEATEALLQGATLTAEDGTFTIPDLERGMSYTVMITAEGYEPAVFEKGLQILPTDPTLTRVEEVRLERP